MKYFLSIIFLLFIFLSACSKKKEEKTPRTKAAIYFNTVSADSSGITFSNKLTHLDDLNIIEYLYYYNGGGVAIGDINNDGLEDIYLSANQLPDRLYLNLGNLKFKDITKSAGIIMDNSWSSGVTMEDVNNDGFLDIYVSKVGNYKSLQASNQLYINNGNNTFTESANEYGLGFSGFSTQASFFDYDNDGDMDMYLMNHAVHTQRSYGNIEKRQDIDSLSGDRLYEQTLVNDKIKFINVSQTAGIYSSPLGYGLALTTADVNKDGFIDIYVGNDFHENDYLYINQGDKTFKESSKHFFNHTSRFTMGVDVADINNDGLLDIFTLDMMPFNAEIFLKSAGEDSDKVTQIKKSFGFGNQYARNTMQLNNNNSSFYDVALFTETYATDWSWSVLMQDFDNDGFSDIYITNGIYKRPNDLNYINFLSSVDFAKYNQSKQNELEKKLIDQMPSVNIPNVIYKNNGDLSFDKITLNGGTTPSYSNGSAYSDLDNDGDLDLVVNNINQTAFLLENKSKRNGDTNYISFSFKTNSILKNAAGTKVYVYAQKDIFYKELQVTKGFQSSSSHKLHFGLGNHNKIDSLKIIWLDGTEQTQHNLIVNEHHILEKNEKLLVPTTFNNGNLFNKIKAFPYSHLENKFLDYEKEPLMPEKLSVEGPAVVQADFNGDNLVDLFIGGAKYQAPSLFIKQKNGSYVKQKSQSISADIIYEDVAATAIDIENDGDLDLYVMSGGNDKTEGHPHLEDRIYINNGNAEFTRLKAPLIKTNGGSIASGDFNGDGFQDLFIGNRSIPGGYGLSPYSFILKNNTKGSFSIVQKNRLGMVTDSKWADINNDGHIDLILVGDWMPITIMENKGDNTFSNQTKKYGLEDTQGMWNTLEVIDLDKNGQLDIIAGNAGLNFKWKASIEKPVKLYLDDFDNNEQLDPIIFYDFFGTSIPFASKDKLMAQMPILKKKFLDYNTYSKVSTVEGLTGKNKDSILETKQISELRSMVYLNQNNIFKGLPLPYKAQMSSIEDFVIDDDKVYFVGNYLNYVTELGNNGASSGGVLSDFTQEKFNTVSELPLPNNLNTRRIIKLDAQHLLIINNNDKAYTVEIP